MLWARLYDLPQIMIKESFARQLGSQLDRFLKVDTRYPDYLRIWVEFPLQRALVPELTVKIKGRGLMHIMVRYENVPHFYFTCGRIGHAAMNCEEGDAEVEKRCVLRHRGELENLLQAIFWQG
jgi:hypothetical protein